MIDHDLDTEPDPLVADLIANLDETALDVVAAHVEAHIGHEYGQWTDAELLTSQTLANTAVRFSIYRPYVDLTGDDRMVDLLADSIVRRLVGDGLDARLCQCRHLHQYGCPHGSAVGQIHCDGHTEIDVPELGGVLLCGPCHVAEYQARSEEIDHG